MTTINAFQPVSATTDASAVRGSGDARSIAAGTVGEIGGRVSAWVAALAPGGGDAAATGGFRPDLSTLSRGGDVYGLRQIAGEIGQRFGATPTQEGELSRALTDLTRAAMVEAAGLHGALDGVRTAGLTSAREAAEAAPASGGGVEEVTARLSAATDALARRSG